MSRNLPQDIIENDVALQEYLKADWIIKAMLHLESSRKEADLTQQKLAELLGTKQSVISRSEADLSGAISIRRYADWLFACGAIPSQMETSTLQEARKNLSTCAIE